MYGRLLVLFGAAGYMHWCVSLCFAPSTLQWALVLLAHSHACSHRLYHPVFVVCWCSVLDCPSGHRISMSASPVHVRYYNGNCSGGLGSRVLRSLALFPCNLITTLAACFAAQGRVYPPAASLRIHTFGPLAATCSLHAVLLRCVLVCLCVLVHIPHTQATHDRANDSLLLQARGSICHSHKLLSNYKHGCPRLHSYLCSRSAGNVCVRAACAQRPAEQMLV